MFLNKLTCRIKTTLAICALTLTANLATNATVMADTFTIDYAGVFLINNGGELISSALPASLSSGSVGEQNQVMKLAGVTSFHGFRLSYDAFILRWTGRTRTPLTTGDMMHIAGEYDITVPTSTPVSSTLHFYVSDAIFNYSRINGYSDDPSTLKVQESNTGALATNLVNADGNDTHTFTFNHQTPILQFEDRVEWEAGTRWQVELKVYASLGHNDRITVTVPNDSIDFTQGTLPGIPEPASLSLFALGSLALIRRKERA
ncbi:hypothetical protein KS4_09220 [Poriferisphaera corsica]|uniref:Ice-binding protein C-terminal domain-containing protein n=1 Tax=Poriferisphaera corsica TaxID=2528020 RepID=A0A517YRP6_9BACT|nr:PEP-CTERM sorting domain-containing protein [Poriferisphaera corsica]QDU32883.1 hypothetical protein KS4_09220 [Poriferisphaera corsica]